MCMYNSVGGRTSQWVACDDDLKGPGTCPSATSMRRTRWLAKSTRPGRILMREPSGGCLDEAFGPSQEEIPAEAHRV